MSLEVIIAIGSAILAWLGFLEKRLRDVKADFKAQLEAKNEINKVIQDDIRKDIARLENKIDMLIDLEMRRPVRTVLNEVHQYKRD